MVKFAPVIVVAALALPGTAFGQATRTWVSGVGDDANPCSRTAPCKTFAGAISKTATGGIIDALDDGGFGALTITKAITVDGGSHLAGVLASGGINAINVAAGSTSRVVLRNLDIEGNGTTLGLNGVRITSARSVKLQHVHISSFSRSGIDLAPNAGTIIKIVVAHSEIHDNLGNGVNVQAPASSSTGKAAIRYTHIDDNTCGIVAAGQGMDSGFNFMGDCAAATSFSGINGAALINTFHTEINDNAFAGILSRGTGAVNRLGDNDVTGNNFGLRALDGGTVASFGNNMVIDNAVNGSPTTPLIPLTKIRAKRG